MLLSSGETRSRVNQTLLSAQWLGELLCFGACISRSSHDSMTHCQICSKQDLASASLERKHQFLPLFLSHPTQQLIATPFSRHPEFIKTRKNVTTPSTHHLGIDFWLGAWKTRCRTAVNRQQQMLHTEFLSFHVENVLLVLQRLLLWARQAGAIVSSNFCQSTKPTVLLQSFLNTLDFCEGPAKTPEL